MVHTFIDHRCDGFFVEGVDTPIKGASVTLTFFDGSRETLQTSLRGLAFFPSIDVSAGVTVNIDLPEKYRHHSLQLCPNSPEQIRLKSDDFPFGFKFLASGADSLGQTPGP